MTIFLRQSTASQEIPLGPFVDSADGNTQETALTIANTDIKVWKTGATTWADKNSGGATHVANGRYYCVLDATDTNTIGPLRVDVHVTGALAVVTHCVVLDEAVYDVLFGTTAPSTYAGGAVASVTAGVTLADSAITAAKIAADAITAAKVAADVSAEIADAVWDEATTGHVTSGTFGEQLKTDVDAILADTNELQVDWVNGGRLDLLIDAIKAKTDNLPTDPADASDVAALITAVDDFVDTEVAAIKTVTDLLRPFVIASGTIGDTGNSTTALHLTGLPFGDDELNSYLLVVLDVSATEYHARWVEDWVNATAVATVATLPFTPENAVDTYTIYAIRADVTGGSGLDAAGVRAAVGLASANLDTQLAAIDDAIDTEVAAILADTNELQTDWANGGRLDLLIDSIVTYTDVIDDGTSGLVKIASDVAAILVDTGTTLQAELDGIQADTEDIQTRLPAALVGGRIDATVDGTGMEAAAAAVIADAVWDELATGHTDAGKAGEQLWTDLDAVLVDTGTTLDGKLDTIDNFLDTEVADILADTNELQTDLADGGRLDLLVDAIKAKTDQLTFTVANQVDANALTVDEDEILDDSLADSVPADGSLPTVRQALYMIWQFLSEKSVSGTTMTVKKADGTTSLMTFTLDDATSPTSITRAT